MNVKKSGLFARVMRAIRDTEELTTPLVIKEGTESIIQLEQYKEELANNPSEALAKKVKLIDLGNKGEAQVLFELKNAFLPLHILHDLQIVHNELTAQIDFVVLTRKFILLVEVKNYFGNIVVNAKDEFLRCVYQGSRLVFQEGFYSPLRQVERQAEVLSGYLIAQGLIDKLPVRYVVVFSNNKTILDTTAASEMVQQQVMRTDGLVSYIKQALTDKSPVYLLDNHMTEISAAIKAAHNVVPVEQKVNVEPINDQTLAQAIKAWRLATATAQGKKAFQIFSNKTLDDLLDKKPCTRNELFEVYGLGEAKVALYGEELLQIMRRYN